MLLGQFIIIMTISVPLCVGVRFLHNVFCVFTMFDVHGISCYYVYMLRPDSQPLTGVEASQTNWCVEYVKHFFLLS